MEAHRSTDESDTCVRESPGSPAWEQLRAELERRSGRQIRTVEDARRYMAEHAARRTFNQTAPRKLHLVRQAMWLLLLAGSFLQYQLLAAMNETVGMTSVVFLTPPVSQSSHHSVKS